MKFIQALTPFWGVSCAGNSGARSQNLSDSLMDGTAMLQSRNSPDLVAECTAL